MDNAWRSRRAGGRGGTGATGLFAGDANYVAVCLPVFAPGTVNRDDD